MSRKTVQVEDVREWANNALSSHNFSTQYKAGICAMIETVLMETGNYKGFNWLEHVNAVETKTGDKDYYDRYYY